MVLHQIRVVRFVETPRNSTNIEREIIKCLKQVKLTEEEEEGTFLEDEDVCKGVEDCVNNYMARLFGAERLPDWVLRQLMKKY